MLAYVVFTLMLISVIISLVMGRGDALLAGTLSGAQDAIDLCIRLVGTMGLWSGLFRVAQKAGLLTMLSRWIRPLTRFLFRGEQDAETLDHITTNMVSNMIGIGNAATPAGLAAMRRMGERSGGKPTAAMAVFCVLNGASIQLIPTTIISMRADAGSAMPADVMVCIWLTSLASAIVGLALVKIMSRKI